VLGRTIDGGPEVKTKNTSPIHKPAPLFVDLVNKAEVYETGIKVIDLIAPMLQ
jgi:F-type H+-transporting ATPase subunit beta